MLNGWSDREFQDEIVARTGASCRTPPCTLRGPRSEARDLSLRPPSRSFLLVVRPHAEDLDDTFLRQDLVHQPVLDVDPSRVGAGQVAHELLEGRRTPEGVIGEQLEQRLRPTRERCRGKSPGVLSCSSSEGAPQAVWMRWLDQLATQIPPSASIVRPSGGPRSTVTNRRRWVWPRSPSLSVTSIGPEAGPSA